MHSFYLDIENGMELDYRLTWLHYKEILKINNIETQNYYIHETITDNLNNIALANKIFYLKDNISN